LCQGLGPFVAHHFEIRHKEQALTAARQYIHEPLFSKPIVNWDAARLFKLVWEAWHDVFSTVSTHAQRGFVRELRDVRNNWAHQEGFSNEDTFRAVDTAWRLLQAVSAPQVEEVAKIKKEVLHLLHDEGQVSAVQQKIVNTPVKRVVEKTGEEETTMALPHCDWVYFAGTSKES
jgi:hypothetical protein